MTPVAQFGTKCDPTCHLRNPKVCANPLLDLPCINVSPPPGSVAPAQVYIDADQFTGASCYGHVPESCATLKPDQEFRAAVWTQAPVTCGAN